jgi:Zn-dependent protease with chaperone function
MRFFSTLFFLGSISVVALANEPRNLDVLEKQSQVEQLPPGHLLNSLIPEDLLKSENLFEQMNATSFPMIPLAVNSFGRSKFLGFKIPAYYLGLDSLISPGVFSTNKISDDSKTKKAISLLRALNTQQDQKFKIYFFNNEIYAIDENQSVTFTDDSCVGFCFGSSNSVYLGQTFTLGFSLNAASSSFDLMEKSGFNLGQSYEDLLTGINLQFSGEKRDQLMQRLNHYNEQIQSVLLAQVEQTQSINKGSKDKSIVLPLRSYRGERPPFQNLGMVPPRSDLSNELQDHLAQLNQDQILEAKKLTESASATVKGTLIVNIPKYTHFIQTLCDRVAQAYQMPQELWPRCHIAAEVVPNAWAYPGGDLFFSVGLIGILQNIDGLLSIVGHEVGHVVGRHTIKSGPIVGGYNSFASFLGFAFNAFQLQSTVQLLRSVHFLTETGRIFAKSQAVGETAQLTMTAMAAGLFAYTRSFEYQADRFGYEAAYASGATSEGMSSVSADFLKFLEKTSARPKSLMERLLSSHPEWKDRKEQFNSKIQNIELRLKTSNEANSIGDDLREQFQNIHGDFSKHVDSYVKEFLEKRKRTATAAQAKQQLEDFILQTYSNRGSRCLLNLELPGLSQ